MEEPIDRLYNFIVNNHPGYEECLVCKSKQADNDGLNEYFLVEKHRGSNCDLYIINAHLWHDYTFMWEENEEPWEIIFKSK